MRTHDCAQVARLDHTAAVHEHHAVRDLAQVIASATLGGGVRISSNVYIMGYSSATKYYGDGSGLTNLSVSGDDLGNHLDLAER